MSMTRGTYIRNAHKVEGMIVHRTKLLRNIFRSVTIKITCFCLQIKSPPKYSPLQLHAFMPQHDPCLSLLKVAIKFLLPAERNAQEKFLRHMLKLGEVLQDELVSWIRFHGVLY